ncbi:hypothetical protein CVT24_010482 [Panaeolus cyanescens]|uniref:Uncharacterized protein n=1 Tax=Panaeolus cyanescens TaxID=181874 RepID=A0A409YVW4_9AGAR|nr:hypothetical protein CVT24_010482 [Panaeolus cyanescens]
MPAQNTSHEATRAGDSFSFSFLGTSATVYGLFSWSNISSLIIQYELDGNTTSQSYPINHSTLLYQENTPVYVNTPFASWESLSPSNHSLKVTVKEIFNTSFRFDYITYTPSFSTLSSRTNSNIVPVHSVTVPSLDNNIDDDHLELKVIIGSVIGGLVLLSLALAGLVCWNRHLNTRARIRLNKVDNAANDAPHAQEQSQSIQNAQKIVHDSTPPFPDQTTVTANQTPPLAVSPYPPEKIPDFYRSSPPRNALPVLDRAPATTVSPYPFEKSPDMSTMVEENPRAATQATASHGEALASGSANEGSVPAAFAGPNEIVSKLATINKTSSRPPSYARSY